MLLARMSRMLLKFTEASFIAARVAAEAPPNLWDWQSLAILVPKELMGSQTCGP